MKSLFMLMPVGLLFAPCMNASGQEDGTAPEVTLDPKVGNSMPSHVVDFVAGARQSGCGCPSVMMSNGHTRGVEIWSRSAGDVAFRLAGVLERKLPDDKKARAFLILFGTSGKDGLKAQADKHGLEKFHVAVPRRSTKRISQIVDRSNDSSLIIFLIDRKQIKLIRRFKPGEVNKEEMRAIVEETEAFLVGQE